VTVLKKQQDTQGCALHIVTLLHAMLSGFKIWLFYSQTYLDGSCFSWGQLHKYICIRAGTIHPSHDSIRSRF